MKTTLRILTVIFVLMSISAFADSYAFYNLNASFVVGPNDVGDNVRGRLWGPGVSIFAVGGTPVRWLDAERPYYPGEMLGGYTEVWWDFGSLNVGSNSYYIGVDPTPIYMKYYTFPANGKDFTVRMPMIFELGGEIICYEESCPTFDLASKPGILKLSFAYDSDGGVYWAKSGSFTTAPEPGTLALMAIGTATLTPRRLARRRQ